jgi:Ankyrin repeats (3 copies)
MLQERGEAFWPRPVFHRLDEFAVGYSLAGCSPALPASASPTDHHFAVKSSCLSTVLQRTVHSVLTVCVSLGARSNTSRRSRFQWQSEADAGSSESGADPNLSGQNGTTPLEEASFKGSDAAVTVLLDHGALVNRLNAGLGTTALNAAASFGKSETVKLLTDREADPGLCGTNRKSAYQAARTNSYPEVALRVLDYGGTYCRHVDNKCGLAGQHQRSRLRRSRSWYFATSFSVITAISQFISTSRRARPDIRSARSLSSSN